MKVKQTAPRSIDEYIAGFPGNVRKVLEKLRKTIRSAAPNAQETISYQIPAFTLNGHLVYFAAWKEHIGFYPASTGIEKFKKELSPYEMSKGTIRFRLDEPIPFDLISRIVKFRVEQNLASAAARKKKG
jgi:uncharacterized protein YdhG (YjbR/CyaY superfamily)